MPLQYPKSKRAFQLAACFSDQAVASFTSPRGFRHHCSLDPDDLINYELCFPGAVTGSTEINCPHCGELLTVPVNDPMGEESYQCRQCTGAFDVDWGEGQIKYSVE